MRSCRTGVPFSEQAEVVVGAERQAVRVARLPTQLDPWYSSQNRVSCSLMLLEAAVRAEERSRDTPRARHRARSERRIRFSPDTRADVDRVQSTEPPVAALERAQPVKP